MGRPEKVKNVMFVPELISYSIVKAWLDQRGAEYQVEEVPVENDTPFYVLYIESDTVWQEAMQLLDER